MILLKLFLALLLVTPSIIASIPTISEADEAKDVVDDLINITINAFINKLDDPLTTNCSFLRFNNAILTGWFNVSELKLTGLKTIVASNIDVKYKILEASSINLTLEVPNLNFRADYDTSLLLGQVLPFWGKGNISANLDALRLEISTLADIVLAPELNISGFKNMSFLFNIDAKSTWLHVEGLYKSEEISELVDGIIDAYLPLIIDFINVNTDLISNLLSPIIEKFLNQFLLLLINK